MGRLGFRFGNVSVYLLLVGACASGGHVHHERSSTTIVKEVDRNTLVTATVAGGEATVEVREEVDLSSVVGTLCEDTRDGDADVGLSVVANDGGVDEKSQESKLVLASVVLEKCGSVVATDGLIGRSLGECRDSGRKTSEDGGGAHDY